MKTLIVQKAAILNDKKEMLILRRSKADVRRPLQWDLPGGLLDDGEELIASVLREIKEETNVEVSDIRLIYSKTEVREWKSNEGPRTDNVVFMFYVAKVKSGGVTLSHEHSEFKWLVLNQLVARFEYDLHKEFLKHAIANQLL